MKRRSLEIAAWVLGGLLSTASLGAPPARPIVAWPAGPLEVRVAFNQPLDPTVAQTLAGRPIPFGPLAKGGEPRLASTLGSLRIAAVRLDDQGRTLILATDPHPRESSYLLTLPISGELRVPYNLSGVEWTWGTGEEEAEAKSSGWWPAFDSRETRALTAGSLEHERGFALLAKPGRLSLRTFVTLPKGKVTVRLEGEGPFEVSLANEEAKPAEGAEGRYRLDWALDSTGEAVDLSATVPTGVAGRAASIRASYKTEADTTERPLPRAWLSLPWAPPPAPTAAAPQPLPFSLNGGDRSRGETVFFSEEAKCSSCHKIRGRGGDVGPDLSALVGRDPAEVYRDIAEPSAVIKPDYMPYTVALKDGQVAVGVVRAEGAEAIRVFDVNGKATVIPRAFIEELRPSGTSVMPVGLVGALGEARMRDLLTFLLSPPPAGGTPRR